VNHPTGSVSKLRRFARLLLRTVLALAILGVVGVASLLLLMHHEHATDLTLPAPTGHFAVGRTTCAWVNSAMTDELAPSPQVRREVLVWIWYPADTDASGKSSDYLPAPWRDALAQASGPFMSRYLTRDPALVHTHSATDPNVSPEQSNYPVLIMRAGGTALTTDYTTLAEDLASHGYIVVGFDAPYRTFTVVFPDGRVVNRPPSNNPENLSPADQARLVSRLLPMWSSDTKFVVDQLERLNTASPSGKFTGRLDLNRLGMFGHSFGGATTLQFCHDDQRCKAGIDIDGDPFGSVLQDAPHQPFFFLLSDHGDLSAPDTREVFSKIRSVYDRLPPGKLLLMVRGANHFSFSDQILLKSGYVVGPMQLLRHGPDARRGLAITTAYVHTFFDVYLKGESPERLEELRRTYPEVQPPTQAPR
jgi:predicted dienelactone hydrolase